MSDDGMTIPKEVDWDSIARRLISLQENMTVTTATLARLDATVSGLVNEFRTLRSHGDRLRRGAERPCAATGLPLPSALSEIHGALRCRDASPQRSSAGAHCRLPLVLTRPVSGRQ